MKRQGHSPDSKKSNPPKSDSKEIALNRAMQYMAIRDHSEKELIKKLKKNFTDVAWQYALELMKTNNWLPEPEILAQRVTDTLHRKKKGHLYIKKYLNERGLKETARNSEIEIEKAQRILEKRFPKVEDRPQSDILKIRQKMMRFLASRGFDGETVRKVVYDWTRN